MNVLLEAVQRWIFQKVSDVYYLLPGPNCLVNELKIVGSNPENNKLWITG